MECRLFSSHGVPVILIGQYMIWGRFVPEAWLKRRTYYAVTNHGVPTVQEGRKRKTNFVLLEPAVFRKCNHLAQ